MADNRKKYTKKQLENLSIEELRRMDKGRSVPPKYIVHSGGVI